MEQEIQIAPIAKRHNQQLYTLIHQVLAEFDADRSGTAFQDEALHDMYGAYQSNKEQYFVALHKNKVIGGSGIGTVHGEPEYCELQKMYVLSNYRGLQVGHRLMKRCIAFAKQAGYSYCYLETFPHMTQAQKLYQSWGFSYFDKRLGNTGHNACEVFMVKAL